MAPDSQCLSQEDVVEIQHSFVNRVMALPALDQAASIYRVTKEQPHYVGVALRLAEAGFLKTISVTGAVMPLATPIANHVVGGWSAVDDWACYWLDNVVKAAPIITKPTNEIVDDTCHFVMKSLAGQQNLDPKLLTFKAALAARASDVVDRASATDCGRVIVSAADSILHSAHNTIDTYLPPAEGDLHHSDGDDGGVKTKAYSLAYKTQDRLRRSVQQMMMEMDDEANDEDNVVIYPLHLVDNGFHQTSKIVDLSDGLLNTHYVKKVAKATNILKITIVKNVGSLQEVTLRTGSLLKTMIMDGAKNVYSLALMRGIYMGTSCASYGAHLTNYVTNVTIGAMQNAIYFANATANSAISTVTAINNSAMKKSSEFLRAVRNGSVFIVHGGMRNSKTLFHISSDSKMIKMTKDLPAAISQTILSLKEKGSNLTSAAREYCNFEKILRMVPPSVYTTGISLYTNFLLTWCAYLPYPQNVLQTSQQVVMNTQSTVMDSCVWLINRDLVIRSHLLVIQFQRTLQAFLKTVSLQQSSLAKVSKD